MIAIVFKRIQILLTLVLVVTSIVMIFAPKIKARKALVQKRLLLEQEITNRQGEIDILQKQEYAIQNDPRSLERIARNKLGYSKPNEIIYKFE
jgi:cell division protein FtsB